MRIVSGIYKRRRINPPANLPVRPTTDFAKEGLFNVLRHLVDFEEISVLDLFAGTGSISYEFASRGAADITSVELNQKCTDFIRKTSENLEIEGLGIIMANVFMFLKQTGKTWDMIFADPPFDMENIEKIPAIVFERKLLKPDGLLIIEHASTKSFNNHPNFSQKRSYGKVQFSFFQNIPETAENS